MLIKKISEKYKSVFESYGEESTRDTFQGELNYESGKLSYLFFMAIVVWLPYIHLDLQLHQFPVFAVALRLSFSLISIILMLCKLTKRFRNSPGFLLMILVTALYIITALVTASAGEAAEAYIGGLVLVLLMPTFVPFTIKIKFSQPILSLFVFFITGALTGLDLSNLSVRYALNDLFAAAALGLMLSLILNGLRTKSWKNQQELKKVIAENEENLITISNLAKKAESSDKAKSIFLATMSHEIRTPMNAIIGIAQIQMQKSNLPDEYAAAIGKIYNSGNSLLRIINDILDISKIETGKMEINPAEYDISSLIHDTVQLNMLLIGSKPIEFILDIDGNLPSILIGDELRIKQILNNLLSNAIKYTEKGYVKLSIKHSVCAPDTVLCITVTDTGQGMRPEDCQRLFSQEYLRFNPEVNRTTEGTGIGLSITKNLAELMEGTVTVESEYGKGSIFTATVKQKTVDCKGIGTELAERLRSFTFSGVKQNKDLQIASEPMSNGKVLIVDDVETNLYVAEGLMSPYGLEIDTAISGFAAIEKVESGRTYDVIFMDHMMPLMDGMETMQKLRALGYKGAIVALTANALAGNAQMFRQNGFDDFISKPIDVHFLDTVLKKYIRVGNQETSSKRFANRAQGAKNSGASREQGAGNSGVSSALLEVFRRDAKKAVVTLRDTSARGDIKLFTTTAHAMKAALANIGEHEMSGVAAAMEDAGLKSDMDFIAANKDSFIATLEALIKILSPSDSVNNDNNLHNDCQNDNPLDLEFLTEQLEIVKSACKDYDDSTAYDALDRLKGKTWGKQTLTALEEIHDMLFLHSNFDEAAEKAQAVINKAGEKP